MSEPTDAEYIAKILSVISKLTNDVNTLKGQIEDDHKEEIERIESHYKQERELYESQRQEQLKNRKIEFNYTLSYNEGNLNFSLVNPEDEELLEKY